MLGSEAWDRPLHEEQWGQGLALLVAGILAWPMPGGGGEERVPPPLSAFREAPASAATLPVIKRKNNCGRGVVGVILPVTIVVRG